MPKMIAFDVGGVIRTQSSFRKDVLIPLLKKYGCKFSHKKLTQVWADYVHGKIGVREVFEHVPKKVFDRAISKIKVRREIYSVVEHLRKAGYRTGILSNAPIEIMAAMKRRFKLRRYFNPIVYSGRYKVWKPNAAIYKIFIEKSKVTPSECYVIDDHTENLFAARKLGMKVILFGRNRKPKWCDFVIKNLNDLKKIL